jgi:formylglycine-generating enzyme required for sulfatase activity
MNVSWVDAVAYAKWLSAETSKRYRLPTESEWEYAARAGSTTKYHWGDEIGINRANCGDCGSRWDYEQTAPVGSFMANEFGLSDMHGNVWEWTQDCWNESYNRAPIDGNAWESGDCDRRVVRGGSWGSLPWYLRSANRYGWTASDRFNKQGFRLAQDH